MSAAAVVLAGSDAHFDAQLPAYRALCEPDSLYEAVGWSSQFCKALLLKTVPM